jgi:alkylation response protein AidB-like acyl-CoA dehydrogenase
MTAAATPARMSDDFVERGGTMDLSLNATQTMLKDSAKAFLAREYPRTVIRELDDTETGFSSELWRQIVDLGWVGLVLPSEYGGADGSFSDAAVLFEEMGYACLSTPLHSSVMLGGLAILEAGTDQQKKDILPSIASGSRILSFALTEPEYGWSPDMVQLRAAQTERGYVLNGTKMFIPDAHIADQILVVARTSQSATNPAFGLTMFLLDKGTPGLSIKVLHGFLGDKVSQVTFDNVRATDANIIGARDGAWQPLERVLDKATLMMCAYMVGAQQRMYEMTSEYAQNRVHFGVPIATFQRIQDYIIEMLNNTDAARWTTYEALWKLDNGLADASEAISTAKAVASDGMPRSMMMAHHVHAGVGGDRNYGLYLYSKKAKTLHSYLGDASHHKQRIADLLHL